MGIFDWPWLAVSSFAVALLMMAIIRASFTRRLGRIARMGARNLVMRLVPRSALERPDGRAVRLSAAGLLIMLGIAGPRWGEEQTVMRGEGIDIVLAMDASLSMLAGDERPSRLERLKQEVRRVRAASRGDRFALLAFAGRSYILSPLTVDDGALDLFLDNLDPSIVGQGGSAVSRAINQGTDLLEASRSAGDRAMVIMSDGEAFDEQTEIMEAAARAGKAGIAVVTVGFGTTEGTTIPIREGDRITEKRDADGNIVVTKYHPEILRAIASTAEGTFIDAGATDKASAIRRALQSLQTTRRNVEAGRSGTPRFQLFVVPALLLILVDAWGRLRRRATPIPRAMAGTAAGLVLLANGCALPGANVTRGGDQFTGGQYARAATSYRQAVNAGDRRPQIMYNLGTALVAADSMSASLEPLERALLREDEEVRYRATFNLGLAYLKLGLAGVPRTDSTRRAYHTAVEAYKRALLMRPGHRDAQWNYELALLELERSGGGGGEQSQSQQRNQREPREQSSGSLGREQAEQLLNSAARDEQRVQGRKQQEARPTTRSVGKDW